MTDPIDSIEWVDASTLDPNDYNPNRVHKAELRLLEHSLLSTGWIQPLLVGNDSLIIDGFHRWMLSTRSKAVMERWKGKVPVARLDLDRGKSMLLTIRINRAKGTHVAVEMSRIVHELLEVHGYAVDELARELGATKAEIDLLSQDGVFQAAKIADWAYSPAWYPAATKADEPEPELPDEQEAVSGAV